MSVSEVSIYLAPLMCSEIRAAGVTRVEGRGTHGTGSCAFVKYLNKMEAQLTSKDFNLKV